MENVEKLYTIGIPLVCKKSCKTRQMTSKQTIVRTISKTTPLPYNIMFIWENSKNIKIKLKLKN